ncbi:hypothetical protein [Bacillus tuaregi]|uniref:hypothetical protein n=1 Tax=Bacillus tuaregi TaxID=1816695 RepID=UPI0008F860A8|nr:hypothetical protein [Bacillus tuaregi]
MILKIASLAVATSFLLVAPSSFAQGTPEAKVKTSVQDEVENLKPYIEVYDAKGKLVKEYSDEEIQELMVQAEQFNKVHEAAEAPVNSPYVHIFDENNHLIDSSVEGAVQKQKSVLDDFQAQRLTYNYGTTSIINNIWVKGGNYFPNPTTITINPRSKFEGLNIKVQKDTSSTPAGNVKIGGFIGGVAVPLSNLYQYAGNYKIQLVNANTNGATIYLNAGTVYYN